MNVSIVREMAADRVDGNGVEGNSVDKEILRILSARPAGGLKVRQIKHRLMEKGIELTSMQLCIVIGRLVVDGTIEQNPSRHNRNFRYSLPK